MSFDPAREAKKAYEDYAKEINKNLRIALDRTMAKAEDRLNEIKNEFDPVINEAIEKM